MIHPSDHGQGQPERFTVSGEPWPRPVARQRAPRKRRVPWNYRAAGAAAAVVVGCAAAVAAGGPAAGHASRPLAPPPLAACVRPGPMPCYAQDPLHEVYGMGALYARGITGAGTTIALIVPCTNPWLRANLGVYSRFFRLPAARVQVIDWHHATVTRPRDAGAVGWAQEGTADLELAHFMAPGARLVYVEIPAMQGPDGTTQAGNAMTALAWLAARQRVDVASFSWGLYEPWITHAGLRLLAGMRAGLQAAVAAGVSVVAGSGDSGAAGPSLSGKGYYRFRTVTWPTSDPLVTGVGGTTMHMNGHGQRTSPDTVAHGGQTAGLPEFAPGGGLSALFPRPAYQDRVARVVGDHRGVVDVSMDAGAWVYIPGTARAGWYAGVGTSFSAPLFAGIVADAAQMAGHPLGPVNPALYQMHGPADGVLDVTSGNNTNHGVPGFSAGPGYDLPSGIGTVANAALFVAALAR